MLDLTHSLATAALLRFVEFVPYVLFGALAGVAIDRADKRRVLFATDAAALVLTLSIPATMAVGAFSLELLFVVAFLLGVCDVVWYLTSDFTILPALVTDGELTSANAGYAMAGRAAHVIGPVAGGMLMVAFGPPGALTVAAATLLPILAVSRTMPALDREERPSRPALSPRTVAREVSGGFRYIARSAVLRSLLMLQLFTNLTNVGVRTLLIFVLKEEHALDPVTIGLAVAATGTLEVVGSLLAPWAARGRPLGRSILAVVAIGGLGTAVAALARDWRVIVAAIGARQTAWAASYVYVLVPRQREVPGPLRAQVNGSFRTLILAASSASAPLLSGIQAVAGSSAAFGACAVLGLAGAALAFFSPLRDYDP